MEQFLTNMAMGFSIAFEAGNLFWVVLGVAWGILAGALPGISGITAMVILLPFTYYMAPERALMTLIGAFTGAAYGGAIPAVLIRTPGIPSAVLTVVEGHQMHLRGESGKALGIALIDGCIGQYISILALIALVIPLSQFAVRFVFPEIFALAVFGLTAAASLTGKNVVKGVLAAAFGVALSTIGPDPVTGQQRFTFRIVELADGLPLIPVLIGMLAVSEVFRASRQVVPWTAITQQFSAKLPSWSDIAGTLKATGIGTGIGIVVGAMPGAGGAVAAFISYGEAKRWSKRPELFGKGSPEGVAAVETANNAVIGGELVPTLGIGIPGSGAMAVLMAAMMLQGVQPGPLLMQNHPRLVYSIFAGLLTATTFMLIIGLLTIRPSIYITTISRPAVLAATMALVIAGLYAVDRQIFHIAVALLFGVVGYFMYRYGYSPAAAVLGFILGKIVEENFRRGLVMSFGSLTEFLARPFTIVFLLMALASFLYPVVVEARRKRQEARRAAVPVQPSEGR